MKSETVGRCGRALLEEVEGLAMAADAGEEATNPKLGAGGSGVFNVADVFSFTVAVGEERHKEDPMVKE